MRRVVCTVLLWLAWICVCVCASVMSVWAADAVPDDSSTPPPSDEIQSNPTEEGAAAPSIQWPDEPVPVYLVEPDEAAGLEPYAVSGTPYDGAISSAALNYFAGIMAKYAGRDYVAFRSGRYEYLLCYGDISWSGSAFGGACTVVSYDTSGSTVAVASRQDTLSMTPANYPVYSSLGDYPALEGVVQIAVSQAYLVGLAVLLLCGVLWVILRPRIRR